MAGPIWKRVMIRVTASEPMAEKQNHSMIEGRRNRTTEEEREIQRRDGAKLRKCSKGNDRRT